MTPPAKSVVDELRTWMDIRLQERLEAFNENVQIGPTMVLTNATTKLLLQILNEQNGRMKKLEHCHIGPRSHSRKYNKRIRNRPRIWPCWGKSTINRNNGYKYRNTLKVSY